MKHSVQIQNNVRCIDSNSFPNSKGITTHSKLNIKARKKFSKESRRRRQL